MWPFLIVDSIESMSQGGVVYIVTIATVATVSTIVAVNRRPVKAGIRRTRIRLGRFFEADLHDEQSPPTKPKRRKP